MPFVYRYAHPDNPWLYVGRTDDLKSRVLCHDTNSTDNIDRKYEQMLRESTVYYIELDSKAQSVYVESFLIDKYQPLLNKQGIYDKSRYSCPIDMILPKWKKYIRKHELEDYDYPEKSLISKIKRQISDKEKEIYKLKQKEKELRQKETGLKELIEECIARKDETTKKIKTTTSHILSSEDISYTLDEIEEIYQAFPNCDMVFTIYACNPKGEYVTYKITNKGLYIDDKFTIERTNVWFQAVAHNPITKINKYTASPIGMYMLSDYYTEQINCLAVDKKIAKIKDVLSYNLSGKWHSDDSSVRIDVEERVQYIDTDKERLEEDMITDAFIKDFLKEYGEIGVSSFSNDSFWDSSKKRDDYYKYKEKKDKIAARIKQFESGKTIESAFRLT